jgi:hypothetical protein
MGAELCGHSLGDQPRCADGPLAWSPETSLKTLDQICVAELPATIEILPEKVTSHNPLPLYYMEHLLEQLVQLAKALDNDSETLQRLIEPPPARRPVGCEMALAPVNSAATQPDEVDS